MIANRVTVKSVAMKVQDWLYRRQLIHEYKKLQSDMALTEHEIAEKRKSLTWMHKRMINLRVEMRAEGITHE